MVVKRNKNKLSFIKIIVIHSGWMTSVDLDPIQRIASVAISKAKLMHTDSCYAKLNGLRSEAVHKAASTRNVRQKASLKKYEPCALGKVTQKNLKKVVAVSKHAAKPRKGLCKDILSDGNCSYRGKQV